MLTRIKALVAAGLRVSIAKLPDGSVDVHICDYSRHCESASQEYSWDRDVDATIEAAVAQAERYLVARDGLSDEARIERALAVECAEVD
jgi:hypothetical protein